MAGLDWYAPRLIDAGDGYFYIGADQLASETFYGKINFAPAPEPGTVILLAAGLMGMIGVQKLTRRRYP